MANNANCPDRTTQYLLSLQTKYRQDDIPQQKLVVATAKVIVPTNPFRVFLSFGIKATLQADVYFLNNAGQLVFYQTSKTPFNVTVTQQLHFLLPTMSWVVIGSAADDLTGIEVVKV